MLKRIFLPLENSPSTMAALNYACFISSRQNAVVTAGIFMDIENMNSSLGTFITGKTVNWCMELPHEIKDLAKPTVEYLIHNFKEVCKRNGVKYTFENEIGMPSTRITHLSNYYDIVVTGIKSDFGLVKRNNGYSFLQKLLLRSATSILVVPDYFREIRDVIIAYDGSISASRALQRFVHFANFSNLNIIIVTSSKNSAWAEDTTKRAKENLLSYGAVNILTDYTKMEIVKVLQSSYFEYSVLIVIGAHSQNMKDIFIGSITKKIIFEANKPLLIGI